jgi:hypothetical protein
LHIWAIVPQSESYNLIDGRPTLSYLVALSHAFGGALLADDEYSANLTEFSAFMPPSEIFTFCSDACEIAVKME